MNLAPMRFRDYVWPNNPETIQIERLKTVGSFPIPHEGRTLQDMGGRGRRVTGSGRFLGEDCLAEFSRLSEAFATEGSGLLRIPGNQPFQAVFSSLTMRGGAGPDCVAYAFVFEEDTLAKAEESLVEDSAVHICAPGETLWEIAAPAGVSVDAMLKENPGIQWPNALDSGFEVKIP